MRKLYTTIALVIVLLTGIQAQNLEQQARELINTNNQVEIKFVEKDLGKLKEVSRKISIENYCRNYFKL